MFKGKYPEDWQKIATACKCEAGGRCIRCGHVHDVQGGYVLTVHHFDGDKGNCEWWNLLALCQRCHLKFQNKVNPATPFFFEHSEWLKPYVAGFYAKKYLQMNLTRVIVMERMEELLQLECKA